MAKVIIIEKCKECPFVWCKAYDQQPQIHKNKSIPKNCPLSDAPANIQQLNQADEQTGGKDG